MIRKDHHRGATTGSGGVGAGESARAPDKSGFHSARGSENDNGKGSRSLLKKHVGQAFQPVKPVWQPWNDRLESRSHSQTESINTLLSGDGPEGHDHRAEAAAAAGESAQAEALTLIHGVGPTGVVPKGLHENSPAFQRGGYGRPLFR